MIADLDPTLILLISTFLGALVSSFAGFAFAPVAGLLMINVFAPTLVLPVLMVCSIIVQTVTLVYLRRSLALSSIGIMLVGGALGVALAVSLFQQIDAPAFQVGFGLFLAGYALVMLVRPAACLRIAASRNRDATVGFLGGLVGGLTAMPGAVPVLYCDLRGVGKEAQRATVQPFILAMQVVALALLGVNGNLDRTVAGLVVWALPALGVGIVVGLALFGRIPDTGFRRVVLLLVLVTGLGTAIRHPSPGPASTPITSGTAVSTRLSTSSCRSPGSVNDKSICPKATAKGFDSGDATRLLHVLVLPAQCNTARVGAFSHLWAGADSHTV